MSSQRRDTRSDVSFQTKYSECLVIVEMTTHIYMPLRETLFYPSCLLSTVTVTPSDLNYVNSSTSLKRVLSKSTEVYENDSLHSDCMRTRQSPNKIVADGSDEGGTSCWIVLFCERYWLAGVGRRGCRQRVASGGKDLLLAQSERFQASKSVGFR